MSSISEYKKVNILQILNYTENPRHEVASNEIDTIKKLINKVGSQYMYNLASDIYVNGLIGANLPTLVFNKAKSKYVVYEGNRRIACIKILDNPKILTTIDNSLLQRIERLKASEKSKYSTDIFCYITNEEEALSIMERIHSGEDKGRGLKAWNPQEKQTFQRRLKNKVSIELVIADSFRKFLNEDVTNKMKFTNIQRIFSKQKIREALNIDNEFSNITREKIILINFLMDRANEESNKKDIPLSRLFNLAKEIEDFFLPLIKDYYDNKGETSEEEQVNTTSSNNDTKENTNPKGASNNDNDNSSEKENVKTSSTSKSDDSFSFELVKDAEKNTYSTDQSINLLEKLIIKNKVNFDSNLLTIDSDGMKIINGILQPVYLPGDYMVTFKYFMDNLKETILWQDNLTITIKPKKKSYDIPKQQTVLSPAFTSKYFDKVQFEYGEKLRSLMIFLSNESKSGRYSYLINIVSRMFLEYSFRMYASKVLKEDNQSIDNRSKSLQGFIDYCCNRIEQEEPNKFVRHIQRGRRDATNKIDILQKSIHYFDVSISNEDIQNMFTNLNIYLEYVYDKILEESLQSIGS